MLFFVSEPVPDSVGNGASFAVGVVTVRCASMSEAVSISQRLRAALQALARRGVRPRLKKGSESITDWMDELVAQSLSSNAPITAPLRDGDGRGHEVEVDEMNKRYRK